MKVLKSPESVVLQFLFRFVTNVQVNMLDNLVIFYCQMWNKMQKYHIFQVPILKEGIRNVNDVSRNLNEKSHFIEAEINAAFDRIVQIVQTRRDKIILELQQKEASKQETLCKNEPLQ